MNDSKVLAIDAGNSFVKVGLFGGDALIGHERYPSKPTLSTEEWAVRFSGFLKEHRIYSGDLQGSVVSSVTPHSTGSIIAALQECQIESVLEVDSTIYPHPIRYDDPSKIGADRLCDAIGGFNRARGPVIVVDFGTAITFNAVSEDGEFLGGAITPGAVAAGASLASGTEQLSIVQPHFPSKVIGTDTETNLASGMTYGWTALVDGLAQRMELEMETMVSVIATGGGGQEYSRQSRRIEAYYPHLTLEGALMIFHSWKEGR